MLFAETGLEAPKNATAAMAGRARSGRECCNHEHTALPIAMHVTIALAAAASKKRPPICRRIFYNWRSLHNSVYIRPGVYLVVCCIGCQISLSQVLLLHESCVEYVTRYFVY